MFIRLVTVGMALIVLTCSKASSRENPPSVDKKNVMCFEDELLVRQARFREAPKLDHDSDLSPRHPAIGSSTIQIAAGSSTHAQLRAAVPDLIMSNQSPPATVSTVGTPLLAQISKVTTDTLAADPNANRDVIAASILYLSEIIHRWNPRFTQQYIAYLLVTDLNRRGMILAIIAPTLQMIDLSIALGKPQLAKSLLNPILAQLNPSSAALLRDKLHLDVTFPKEIYRSHTGSFDAIASQMAKMDIGPHYLQSNSSSPPSTVQIPATPRVYGVGDVIEGPGSYLAYSQRTSSATASNETTATATPTPGPLSGKSPMECGVCLMSAVLLFRQQTRDPYEGPLEDVIDAISEEAAGKFATKLCGVACGEPQKKEPEPQKAQSSATPPPSPQHSDPKVYIDTDKPLFSGRDPDVRQPDDPLFDKASRTAMTSPDWVGPDLPPNIAPFADTSYLNIISQASFLRVSALQDDSVNTLRGGFDMKKAMSDLKARQARGEFNLPSSPAHLQ